jgi:methionyl-tRNA synthetase
MLGLQPQPAAWASLTRGDLPAGTKLGESSPLFPRIEQSVEELQQMSDTSGPSNKPQALPIPPGASVPPERPAAEQQPSEQPPRPGDDARPEAKPAAAQPQAGERISIDDFMKVELRVAKVLAAERVPKSNRLLKLSVDAGSEQRTIVAGIAEAYEPESLVGRTVVIVFNLKPAKLMGVESNGMVLAASPEGGRPTLVGFVEPPEPGTRVR